MSKGRRQTDEQKAQELAVGLRRIMEEAGVSEGTATVYRKVPGADEQYLDKIGVDVLEHDVLETLKARFGGGRYHILLRDQHGDYVKGGSLHFNIAGEPKDAGDRMEQLEQKLTEQLEKVAGDGKGMDPVTRVMIDTMREQMRELRAELRSRQAAPQADPMQTAVALMAALQNANQPILEALLSRAEERRDPLEELTRMAQLVQLLKDDSGGGMDAIAKQLASPLGKLLEGAAGQTPVTQQQPPGGAPMQNPPDPDRPAWWPVFGRAVPQLLEWAKAGKDPELRADFVLDELPDEYLGPVYEQLSRGDVFMEEFLAAVPAARPHRQWFDDFFVRILAQIRPVELEQPDEDEEPETVVATNVEDDEAPPAPTSVVDSGGDSVDTEAVN